VTGFITILSIVILALFVLAIKSYWIWKRQKQNYANIQSNRSPITDEVFCEKLGLDTSCSNIVSILRSKISNLGDYDPLRIYPDDEFYSHFGLDYDDDVAMFLQETKVIEGYREYSFPLEEVKTVGDFVKAVFRLKKEFEAAKALQK
jgi:hypothetical protein